MYRNRIIPCLLLKDERLVKTVKFKDPNYIGDPLNAVRIFNDKEADELFFIDISASKRESINFDLLKKISSQSFMPLGYAGGIKCLNDAKKIFSIGFEKISLNTIVLKNPDLITEISKIYGSQSVLVTIDVKKNFFGKYYVYNHLKKKITKYNPVDFARKMEVLGAGELVINCVDNDGVMKGYNLKLIGEISKAVKIPIVALGGAGSLKDLDDAINVGASAAGAGSLFIYYGPHKAVLINYPRGD
ncbi:AglZ/HisF2 family acetamidino modification protein [Methanococcus maripaludis]|uniref:Imidazole glycerol phosphate synthase subunit HisF n=1 Tax=Methanococcus maripaludis (strain DSM 14266 / JCM 13030 / NBRC 101832 / S2 / LL) TaxID=267377 RepID=Q6LYA8_METMP|nr:AglZ/HisF2 family acetamidino modification protein [Methanococcus maripaludis]CAF30639.1 Similar to bacterial imidazoleglycerol-phosphate synthase, cyclase subunit [Methanococcus maripaludis S2]